MQRPGDIFRNLQRGVGVNKFSKDTYTTQHATPAPPKVEETKVEEPIIEPVIEPIIEEPIQEIKPKLNELQRTQVEQATLPSGSEYTRKPSTGDKQTPPRKFRV